MLNVLGDNINSRNDRSPNFRYTLKNRLAIKRKTNTRSIVKLQTHLSVVQKIIKFPFFISEFVQVCILGFAELLLLHIYVYDLFLFTSISVLVNTMIIAFHLKIHYPNYYLNRTHLNNFHTSRDKNIGLPPILRWIFAYMCLILHFITFDYFLIAFYSSVHYYFNEYLDQTRFSESFKTSNARVGDESLAISSL